MSKLGDIRTALLARLAVINGTGGYTYDLSVAGRVLWGGGVPIDTSDIVVVIGPDSPLKVAPDYALTCWGFRSSYALIGFVPSAADTPTDRYTAAANLIEDIVDALTADRTVALSGTGLVWDIEEIAIEVVDDQELDASGAAVVAGRVTLKWGGPTL